MRSDAVSGAGVLLDGLLMVVLAEVEDGEEEWEGSQEDSADGPARSLDSTATQGGTKAHDINQSSSRSLIKLESCEKQSRRTAVRINKYELQHAKRPSSGKPNHWPSFPANDIKQAPTASSTATPPLLLRRCRSPRPQSRPSSASATPTVARFASDESQPARETRAKLPALAPRRGAQA